METKNKILYAALFFAVILIANVACGNTVDIAHAGYEAHSSLHVWGAGLSDEEINAGVSVLNKSNAGVSVLNKSGATGLGNLWENGDIFGFCIEFTEDPSGSTHTYDVVTPDQAQKPITTLGDIVGTVKAGYISELWARYYNPEWTNVSVLTFDYNYEAEAFASCLWEIVYENLPTTPLGWDVTTDGTPGDLGFKCLYSNSDMANSWLHSLTGQGPRADLMAFVRDGTQDFIVEVPEPATICLFGFGMLAMFRQRNKE
ncbi:MAG: PEP-CTERM sorting domain-containing protein [Planctomycetota bacterium]